MFLPQDNSQNQTPLSLEQRIGRYNYNGTAWIQINPVGDKYIGEKFTVTARTNLSVGTKKVLAQTFPLSYNPVNRTDAGSSVLSASIIVNVTDGIAGINNISFELDPKGFRPETYLICIDEYPAAGYCTWYNVSVKPDKNDELSQTPVLKGTSSVNNENSSHLWINVDPIPDHYLGDNITFEGTTNLAFGKMITIRISESWGRCSKCQMRIDSVRYCCGDFYRMVAIRPGDSGKNFWSFNVNTSYHDFRPNEYRIETYGRDDRVENASLFNILDEPKPDPFHYITLNLPENIPNENVIRLSGTVNTSNGPREKLFLQIFSDSGAKVSSTLPVVFDGTGYRWNYTVKMSELSPLSMYSVNISSVFDPKIGNRSLFMV